jgi:polysaccharide export outer membrane protein
MPNPALILLAAAFTLVGCAGAPLAGPPAEDASTTAPVGYRIGPEDVIEVTLWKNEAVSRTVPVRPDGALSLPLINDVQAAGLTPMQLRQVITERMTAFLSAPEVSVIVREVHSAKVSVLGAVARPGRYDLRGPSTALEMIALAGGLSPFASASQIVILRPRGDQRERIPVDGDQAISDQHHQTVLLQSGDLVFVP